MNRHLLIIYPHWPPSNLAGVHRARLTANFASDSGWKVTVITVHERHYEEVLDPEINRLVRPGVHVIKTAAYNVLRLFGRRITGDIGLRAYRHLKRAAIEFIPKNDVDFIWIPIPSWYTALMGNSLSKRFKIPFGIDYIDPWVYQLTIHESTFSRAWWTREFAKILEPIAIRNSTLISGVSEAYFAPALERVFGERKRPATVAMPYGFDPKDHTIAPQDPQHPFNTESNRFILYAGAFLPHSEKFARTLFSELAALMESDSWPNDLHLHFVGTGHRPGPSIHELAQQAGVSELIHEHPHRVPFLTVQSLLRQATASLVLGSTEPHYTASKTFQCLLANKPVIALLHEESSALRFMASCQASDFCIGWSLESAHHFASSIRTTLMHFMQAAPDSWNPDLSKLDVHSAKASTQALLEKITEVVK